MNFNKWSKIFENYKAIENIPSRVRKIESIYWCWFFVTIAIMIAGILMMLIPSQSLLGLFIAIMGAVSNAVIKLWMHIRISTYQIIMELKPKDN